MKENFVIFIQVCNLILSLRGLRDLWFVFWFHVKRSLKLRIGFLLYDSIVLFWLKTREEFFHFFKFCHLFFSRVFSQKLVSIFTQGFNFDSELEGSVIYGDLFSIWFLFSAFPQAQNWILILYITQYLSFLTGNSKGKFFLLF